ncbi:MAG: hypothetical protein R2932_59520 [Caldilineaceae bacterium]
MARIIAGVVRYNGGRQAQGYGHVYADFQVKMAATAYNLKRWHKLTLERKRAQRYRPPPSLVIAVSASGQKPVDSVRQGLKTPGYRTTPGKPGFPDTLSPVYRALLVALCFSAGRIPSETLY